MYFIQFMWIYMYVQWKPDIYSRFFFRSRHFSIRLNTLFAVQSTVIMKSTIQIPFGQKQLQYFEQQLETNYILLKQQFSEIEVFTINHWPNFSITTNISQ